MKLGALSLNQQEDFSWALAYNEPGSGSELCSKLRDLNGTDFIFAAKENLFADDNPLTLLALYDRLIITEGFIPTDLELEIYKDFATIISMKIFDERLFTPDNFLELVYFLQNETFTPNIQDWFNVPITLILAMRKVVEKNPRQKLV
jgi:hypothetical protein